MKTIKLISHKFSQNNIVNMQKIKNALFLFYSYYINIPALLQVLIFT